MDGGCAAECRERRYEASVRVSREERANTVLAGQWQWRIDCLFGQVGTRVQLERACLCLDSRVWRVGHELELQWATIDKSARVCVRHARTLSIFDEI